MLNFSKYLLVIIFILSFAACGNENRIEIDVHESITVQSDHQIKTSGDEMYIEIEATIDPLVPCDIYFGSIRINDGIETSMVTIQEKDGEEKEVYKDHDSFLGPGPNNFVFRAYFPYDENIVIDKVTVMLYWWSSIGYPGGSISSPKLEGYELGPFELVL